MMTLPVLMCFLVSAFEHISAKSAAHYGNGRY
jgi:hypothetical protein